MIPVLAIIIGLLIGLFITVSLPNMLYMYLALIILCTLDSLIGGIKARYARKYSTALFITGWISNCLVAIFLKALGDALGLDLSMPVVILLGMRIFQNLASLRRIWLGRLHRRQRTVRVWLEKSGQKPYELPLESASGELTDRQKKVEELRAQARRLRLEADSLLNEADILIEEDAMTQLAHLQDRNTGSGEEAQTDLDDELPKDKLESLNVEEEVPNREKEDDSSIAKK